MFGGGHFQGGISYPMAGVRIPDLITIQELEAPLQRRHEDLAFAYAQSKKWASAIYAETIAI
jgi:hypothetical protein